MILECSLTEQTEYQVAQLWYSLYVFKPGQFRDLSTQL